MMNKILEFTPMEPLLSNRWLIKLNGLHIEPFLFRKYKIYNQGDDIIFTTQFFETVQHSYNPKDFFNIEDITIEYLDPVGDVVNGLTFKPKGINFKRKHSYSNNNLMITKLRTIIDAKTLTLIYKNTENE